jgi:tripartite-type tricarboxylate transporter receptor subunit TctC
VIRAIHYSCLIVCAVVCAETASAQVQKPSAQAQWPTKPLRIILPYPPGGGTDFLGRIVGQKLAEALGQPVIPDNRPGANSNLGAEFAARSAPDGYTLLLTNMSHAVNASFYPRLGYDIVKDFAPVSLLASHPHVLVVHPSLPVKSVRELIALAKTRPGQLDYSSAGVGSSPHLAAELFDTMARIKMTHIPYNGGSASVVAIMGGQVQLGFPTTPTAIPQLKSGKLRGVAVTSAQRAPSIPDLPTISESGLPGYEIIIWYGLLVPAGTPSDLIARLHAESVKLLNAPDVRERLSAAGFEPIGTTPEQFGPYIRDEVAKWAKVVKATGIRAED